MNWDFHLRFEVLTAVKMSVLVFWVVTPCELVGRFWRNILPPYSATKIDELYSFGMW
jgi:hypothetical protein